MMQTKLEAVVNQYPININQMEETQRSLYSLKTNRGLKKLMTWENQDQLRFQHQFREDLTQAGFRKIERFIRSKDGSPYINYEGDSYSLVDEIEGKIPTLSEDDLKCVSRTLAQLHVAMARIQVRKDWKPWSVHFNRGLEQLDNIETLINQSTRLTPVDTTVQQQLPQLKEQIIKAIELAEKLEKSYFRNSREHQLIHGNIKLNTFRIDEYGEGWIKELGVPKYELPIYDIAKLISHVYQKGNFDEEKVFIILDEYQKVTSFTKEDKQWLLTYFSYPHDLWKFLYTYYILGMKQIGIDTNQQLKQLLGLKINNEQLVHSLNAYF